MLTRGENSAFQTIESGTVRAVPLAGGRSPGRVRSSVRVLESRMLSMAALLGF